eukprot:scaffold221353_cov24-Tisochrysis_lutea.AAC.1
MPASSCLRSWTWIHCVAASAHAKLAVRSLSAAMFGYSVPVIVERSWLMPQKPNMRLSCCTVCAQAMEAWFPEEVWEHGGSMVKAWWKYGVQRKHGVQRNC